MMHCDSDMSISARDVVTSGSPSGPVSVAGPRPECADVGCVLVASGDPANAAVTSGGPSGPVLAAGLHRDVLAACSVDDLPDDGEEVHDGRLCEPSSEVSGSRDDPRASTAGGLPPIPEGEENGDDEEEDDEWPCEPSSRWTSLVMGSAEVPQIPALDECAAEALFYSVMQCATKRCEVKCFRTFATVGRRVMEAFMLQRKDSFALMLNSDRQYVRDVLVDAVLHAWKAFQDDDGG